VVDPRILCTFYYQLPMQEPNEEEKFVYEAAMQLIQIKGLESFIEYLQEVDESGRVPASTTLDRDEYLSVLRRAISDFRKKLLNNPAPE
jgi:hypothetical protein